MIRRTNPVRFALTAAACLTLGAAVWTHTASAADKSNEERIDSHITKDADDHLKNNLSDEQKRELLKKEVVRAEAMRELAATLAADSKFQQAYKTLISNSAKRKADVMPSDKEISKEKSNIVNDEAAMRMVMAQAMVQIEHGK